MDSRLLAVGSQPLQDKDDIPLRPRRSSSQEMRISDAVNTQILSGMSSAVADEMVEAGIRRVLFIYTGGTIGMKHTPEFGYLPVPNHLIKVLSSSARFHDPNYVSNDVSSIVGIISATSLSGTLPEKRDLLRGKSTERLFNNIRMPSLAHGELLPDDGLQDDCRRETLVDGSTRITPVKEIRALITPPSIWGKRIKYSVLEYDPLLDSSNMTMADWINIVSSIEDNYALYDAFIILHGTDTMAYTASALSFMLENLGKTVIITGSQVPLAEIRNDAVENLLGALTIAGHFVIPEVTLYFNNKLFRGNRTSKMDAVDFHAFDSPNMRPLVNVGINIDVAWGEVWRPNFLARFKAHKTMNPNVAALRLFPGITESTVRAFLQPPIQAVVLETYGAGNAPNNRIDLLNALKEASDRGVVIVNCTQCKRGLVSDIYSTGKALLSVGVVPGADMTPECALTKLSYLIGRGYLPQDCRSLIRRNLRGELTILESGQRFALWNTKNRDVFKTLVKWMGPATILSPHLISRVSSFEHPDAIRNSTNAIDKNKVASDELRGLNEGYDIMENTLYPLMICASASVGDIKALRVVEEGMMDSSHRRSLQVNITDHTGSTPLHHAATAGHIDIVRHLLLIGASVHSRNRMGHTPLWNAAVRARNQEIVSLLRTTGAHFAEEEIPEVEREIFEVVRQGNLGQLQLFSSAGANLAAKTWDRRTVLHVAAATLNEEIVMYLVAQEEVRGYIDTLDRWQHTPMDEARLSLTNAGSDNSEFQEKYNIIARVLKGG